MNWNATVIQPLLLLLTMASSHSHQQMPVNSASHHTPLPKRHIHNSATGNHADPNGQFTNPLIKLFTSSHEQYPTPPKLYSTNRHNNQPTSHNNQQKGKHHVANHSTIQHYPNAPCGSHHNTNDQHTPPHSPNSYQFGQQSAPTHSATASLKPLVSQREQEIMAVYHNTLAQVTQISSKIAEINHHLLNHSLDVVAANMLRFDQYVTDIDYKTKDCRYNSEDQLQRVKELLQQKLKTKISHCMTRVNRLDGCDKSIREELSKYNNVMLLQVKNILVICNKMQGNVMQLCLNKSSQICAHVSDKFLSTVNGFLNHAILVYNQSNGPLVECLQKDVQVNKKYFNWAIKLFRTSNCKTLLNS